MTQLAPSLFPKHAPFMFGIGLALLIAGLAGFVWALWVVKRSGGGQTVAPREQSVTFDIADSDDVLLDDTYSKADKLAHVRDVKRLHSRKNRHDPRTPRR